MIRPASPSDIPDIAAIFAEGIPSPWKEDALFSALSDPGMHLFVWDEANTVLAAVLFSTCLDEGEILSIATKKTARRRGIARALLSAVLSASVEITAFFLEVRSRNVAAISLYHALGFSEIAVRKRYYSNPCDDAICMKFGKN